MGIPTNSVAGVVIFKVEKGAAIVLHKLVVPLVPVDTNNIAEFAAFVVGI